MTNAQQLADAPTGIQPPPEPKPESYTVEFLVETPEGFHALFRGEGLTGKEMLPWMLATSKGLAAKGFKAVRRDMVVDVDVTNPIASQPDEVAGVGVGRSGRGARPGGRQQAARQERPARQNVPAPDACDMCGGPIWDNRAKKASGAYKRTAPDYSCQDKDNCGAIAWQPKDGEPDWKYPAA